MHSFPSLAHLRLAVIALGCVALSDPLACAATQTVPLDPKGSSLTFLGESTLHNFHGEAREFTGTATVDTDAKPPVQKATLHFKTAALTTFEEKRDQKMREWLKIDVHPDATFTLESVKLVSGDAEKASPTQPARFTVSGELTLNGMKQPITGSASGWREKDRLIVTGDAVVDTLKYGLPQIRVTFMTVGTNVKTSYRFSFILPHAYAAK
jgi:polyisoprenoid-binding protein YceI